MRRINLLFPLDNFLLRIIFDNGIEKVFDMKPYLHMPAFTILLKPDEFQKVVNKGYFIEWPSHEVDLSADTLWHEGK